MSPGADIRGGNVQVDLGQLEVAVLDVVLRTGMEASRLVQDIKGLQKSGNNENTGNLTLYGRPKEE